MQFYIVGGFFTPQACVVAVGQHIEDEDCKDCIDPGLQRQFDPTREYQIFDASMNYLEEAMKGSWCIVLF